MCVIRTGSRHASIIKIITRASSGASRLQGWPRPHPFTASLSSSDSFSLRLFLSRRSNLSSKGCLNHLSEGVSYLWVTYYTCSEYISQLLYFYCWLISCPTLFTCCSRFPYWTIFTDFLSQLIFSFSLSLSLSHTHTHTHTTTHTHIHTHIHAHT